VPYRPPKSCDDFCENLSSLRRERSRTQSQVRECPWANAAAVPQRHACTVTQRAARNRNQKLRRKQARSSCPACAHIALTIACMSTYTHHSDLRVLTESSAIALEHRALGELRRFCENLSSLPRERPRAQLRVQECTRLGRTPPRSRSAMHAPSCSTQPGIETRN
jgi:hypothetical protein